MFNSQDALEFSPHSVPKRPAQDKPPTLAIQECELRALAITKKQFEKLTSGAQKQVKRLVEIDRQKEHEEHKQRAQKEQEKEQRQMRLGFCDMLKSPAPGHIKIDLAINKNAIFVVNSFAEDWRECTRNIKTPDGGTITQKITVGRVQGDARGRGVLKQKHEQVMYGLFDLWARTGAKLAVVNGSTRGCITTSAHRLIACIYARDNADAYKHIRSTLRDLASIPITIKNAYTRHGVRELEFTILGEVEWNIQHKKNEKEDTPPDETWRQSGVRILFSRFVTENFLQGYVKDFRLKAYNEIGGGNRQGPRKTAAQGLYRLLDTQLGTKATYSISLSRLAEDLGMQAHSHKSKRKEKFRQAVAAVNGRPLRSGSCRARVHLRLSEDRSDYILVARCDDGSAANQANAAGFPTGPLASICDWAARVKQSTFSAHAGG